MQAVLQQEEWIIDGNYASTMELRLQACDTVIFLDYPTQVCLDGVRKGRENLARICHQLKHRRTASLSSSSNGITKKADRR